MRCFFLFLGVMALLSCSTPTTNSSTESTMPPRITEVSQARNAIGQEVRVVGEAQRTKLAPSVSTGSFHIYCLGQEEWSPDRLGQQVVVTGRLDLTDEFQATGSVEEGTISQGTGGPVWVLRQCQIHDSGAE